MDCSALTLLSVVTPNSQIYAKAETMNQRRSWAASLRCHEGSEAKRCVNQ